VAPTEAAIIEALRPVHDPELGRSIVELEMVRSIAVTGPTVTVGIDLTVAGCPLRAEINRSVSAAVEALDGVNDVVVEFGVMTDEQRADLRRKLHGDPSASAGSQPSHGHAEGRAIPFAQTDNRTRVILVASGKGGVGKSSVTTNLAVALAARGAQTDGGPVADRPPKRRVAVVDADVWGFSIPRMLGVDRDPVVIDEMIVPPEAHGVRCMSMGFFVEENQPVIWRGPMLHKALEQFLTDVFWDDPDYLIVDLPPGTGDIALSLAQFLPRAELLVVTTPQPAAQKVAQRAAYMAHKVHITVAGVIENMSWFTGDDGKRYELFGAGGGQELADDLQVPLLAQVPLVPELRAGGDTGHPIALDATSEAGAIFAQLAERVDVELAPKKRFRSELKIV
jgi:ATP-binding protein involved in chromosome partitioning